jgi:metal-sulfur cluster biosynthetic enzyme
VQNTDNTGRKPLDLMVSLASGQPGPGTLRDLLRDVIDPEIGINIVDLGLLYDIRLSGDGTAEVRMTLTTPGCPLGGYLTDSIRDTLHDVPGVSGVDVQIVWEPPWDPMAMMSDWAKDQLGWNR